MRDLDFDAITIGNQDLGELPYLHKAMVNLGDIFISANAHPLKLQWSNYIKPYRVFEIDGLKIVVVGITTTDSLLWLDKNTWQHFFIQGIADSLERIQKEVLQHKADLIIGMFHISRFGLAQRTNAYLKNISITPSIENILRKFTWFDLIISGQELRVIANDKANRINRILSVPVVGGGDSGKRLLSLQLHYDHNEWQFNVTGYNPDGSVQAITRTDDFEAYFEEDTNWQYTIRATNLQIQECLNELIHRAITVNSGAQHSFFTQSSIHKKPVLNDFIDRKYIFLWMRYFNVPVEILLSQKDIIHIKANSKKNKITIFYSGATESRQSNGLNFFTDHEEYKRDTLFVTSNFIANGGRGVLTSLPKYSNKFVYGSDSFMELIFDYMIQYSPSQSCYMFSKTANEIEKQ